LSLSAAPIWQAFALASVRSSLKTVTFRIAAFVQPSICLVCRNVIAAARFGERKEDGAGRRFDVQQDGAAARRSQRQPSRQLLFQPWYRTENAAGENERELGADDLQPPRDGQGRRLQLIGGAAQDADGDRIAVTEGRLDALREQAIAAGRSVPW
jgi:hypothetical protein